MSPLLKGIEITDLVYGSPTIKQIDIMNNKGKALQMLLENKEAYGMFFNTPFPSNISPQVRQELKELDTRTKKISKQDLQFAEISEKDHYQSWVDFMYQLGANVPKTFFSNIAKNTDGLVYALKYHYNRPRPFQLGYYHGIPINQTILTSANSPAYPSGHAFESKLFSLILSQKYTFAKDKIISFGEKHAESRLNAGVHYKSDMIFGYKLADWVFSQNYF
jgi:hypothetical protein